MRTSRVFLVRAAVHVLRAAEAGWRARAAPFAAFGAIRRLHVVFLVPHGLLYCDSTIAAAACEARNLVCEESCTR